MILILEDRGKYISWSFIKFYRDVDNIEEGFSEDLCFSRCDNKYFVEARI